MRRNSTIVCIACLWFAGCRPHVHIVREAPGPIVPPSNYPRAIPSEDRSDSGPDLKAPVVHRDPPAKAPNAKESKTPEERLESEVKDAFFDYNRSDLRPDARAALDQDAAAMKSIFQDFPGIVLSVEGHCDERGSAEYNLALGDLRARTARDFLVELGVAGRQLEVISYGKERPQCAEAEESCWQKNRRAHVAKK